MMSEETQESGVVARTTKAELLERIRTSRKELAMALVELDEEELEAYDEDGWNVKDQIAHLAAWERGVAYMLQKRPRYAGMGLDKASWYDLTMDEINAVIHRQYLDVSLEEVLAYYQEAHQELLAALEKLSDEDLFRPYSYYQSDDSSRDAEQPIINWISGNTYEHYDEHLRIIRESHGL
jgi:hypothetical protein